MSGKECKARRSRSPSQEKVSLDDSDESGSSDIAKETSPATKAKEGWFSWKSRRFSFKRAKTKEGKLDEKTNCCDDTNMTENDVSSSAEEPELLQLSMMSRLKNEHLWHCLDTATEGFFT